MDAFEEIDNNPGVIHSKPNLEQKLAKAHDEWVRNRVGNNYENLLRVVVAYYEVLCYKDKVTQNAAEELRSFVWRNAGDFAKAQGA